MPYPCLPSQKPIKATPDDDSATPDLPHCFYSLLVSVGWRHDGHAVGIGDTNVDGGAARGELTESGVGEQ
jgi:hypothetical protein